MHALIPAVLAVTVVAMSSAALGVMVARLVWSEDLRNAEEIKKITDRTEASLRRQIAVQTETIAILRSRLKE